MSVYFDKKRNWWIYEFRYKGLRYRKAGFKLKKEAAAEEAEARKLAKRPPPPPPQETPTVMAFLDLINERLDFIQAYRSEKYYTDYLYMAKRWIREWQDETVESVTPTMLTKFLVNIKNTVSAYSANKELRSLRATFNFGIKPPNRWFTENPTDGISFFPVEKELKYVPPIEDVIKVIMVADGEQQDYLWTLALTMARMSEINRLTWKDVDFENGAVVLYSRKTRGGNLVPRRIPMYSRLRSILERRIKNHKTDVPWVFYHTYCSSKTKEWVTGPYKDRKRIMTTLCEKAGVKYFRFHPLRHFGASILEKEGVPIKTIQELLGHSNRTTTEIYLHSFEGSNTDAIDRLGDTLNCNHGSAFLEKSPTKLPHKDKGVIRRIG